jgi:sugar lactone lactonase YvrE
LPGRSLPSYVPGWDVPAGDLVGFAFDAQDRAWLLAKDPAFVRLDEQGKEVERIPFTWPADLSKNNPLDCPFLLSGEDFVVGHYRFDHGGKVVALYPFRQSRLLAAGPDGTVVRQMDGLEVYDAKGKLLRRFSEGGLAPGKLNIAVGLAVDRRGRIFVAERQRLQIFDRQGKLMRAVDLPAELRAQGILGLAMDRDGYLYAPQPQPAGSVAVFDPELRYLGSVQIGGEGFAWSLKADGQGRLTPGSKGSPTPAWTSRPAP